MTWYMFIYDDELVTGGNSKGHLTIRNPIDRLLLLWDTGRTGWFMRIIAWSMLWSWSIRAYAESFERVENQKARL